MVICCQFSDTKFVEFFCLRTFSRLEKQIPGKNVCII